MRVGHQKAMIKSLVFSPNPYPPERGEGLEKELIINHAYKIQRVEG